MGLLSTWQASDFQNAKELWLAGQQYNHRQIIFRKFAGYETQQGAVPEETFQRAKYSERAEHVWLSLVKVYDTVKGGYFTTGDLDVNSTFRIQGFTPAYTLPSGVKIDQYGGDEIIWNGSLWVPSDQIEPIQAGLLAKAVFYRTVLRRTDRTGPGVEVGP